MLRARIVARMRVVERMLDARDVARATRLHRQGAWHRLENPSAQTFTPGRVVWSAARWYGTERSSDGEDDEAASRDTRLYDGDVMREERLRKQSEMRIAEFMKQGYGYSSEGVEQVESEDQLVDKAIAAQMRQQILEEEQHNLRKGTKKLPVVTGEQLSVGEVVELVKDSLGGDIKVLDVSTKASFTDAIIVCSAKSVRHLYAIGNTVLKQVQMRKILVNGRVPVLEGRERSDNWLVMDGGEWVLHVMLPALRREVGLEDLWGADYEPSGSIEDHEELN
ncbi:Mitochondrial assembly of ribosomal large subunit protein 1 [Porphyridium purpureum]|uniref:Mitochondrial assembly of ribosomal large subunit protein 1 n=1 Tax=Porphyridium purpureum TaxID=35688 RepID=A0A5J4Z5Q9_PORPP|nr:Mitochondrial assembly of ribosomal large subunit protein 1 [Porphyridium purpureum]|eukprot:POR2095..scf295_1